ncbi:hypothetical protein RHSIM_Rhsim10G0001900 [Rhododendron simsii]|uniref:Uncharacterized protein n=1 Tax=Rhododendron simsii TaxID=118357 RepID=A0A834GHA3_RHOSS|nr:hypothetical protein RHSIM_Rhsim10G0001900 [Rhododendron simsii]
MAFPENCRPPLIPSFLYSCSTSSSTLFLEKCSSSTLCPSPPPCANGTGGLSSSNIISFLIPAPIEPPETKIELYSPQYYVACTVSGILSCGLTHTAVTPLDLVKCNMQFPQLANRTVVHGTGRLSVWSFSVVAGLAPVIGGPGIDPSKYKSISSGFRVLLKEQGVRGLFRGWAPTLVGYSAQEFIADIALCPFEAVKVRVQTQPGFARGVSDGFPKVVKSEGLLGLYKGLVPLWGNQIPYTTMKFASFETIVEMLYKYAIPTPKNECSKPLQLAVSFAGGYVAGVFCAIVSHPADNLVSFLNCAKGATVGDAMKQLGLWGLFTRGLPLRIVMIGTLTGAQWGIYDAFKVFVGL